MKSGYYRENWQINEEPDWSSKHPFISSFMTQLFISIWMDWLPLLVLDVQKKDNIPDLTFCFTWNLFSVLQKRTVLWFHFTRNSRIETERKEGILLEAKLNQTIVYCEEGNQIWYIYKLFLFGLVLSTGLTDMMISSFICYRWSAPVPNVILCVWFNVSLVKKEVDSDSFQIQK